MLSNLQQTGFSWRNQLLYLYTWKHPVHFPLMQGARENTTYWWYLLALYFCVSSIRQGIGDNSIGHMKARKAFKSSSSNKRTWTLLHSVGKQHYWSQPLHGTRGIKCYCLNWQHCLFLLSGCQIPLFGCMEKSRSVTSAGRRLLCQWRCRFNIHLFTTKSESPGSIRSILPVTGPEESWAKQMEQGPRSPAL